MDRAQFHNQQGKMECRANNYRKERILIVLTLFGHLIIISGYFAHLSSNTRPGRLLQFIGGALNLPVILSRLRSRDYLQYSSAPTRRLTIAAASIQVFGFICIMIWSIISDLTHDKKSWVWLAIIASFSMFIGELLLAVKTLKMQQMKGCVCDTKESMSP